MSDIINSILEKKKWKVGVDFPEWGLTDVYLQTITNGYLLENETPRDAYKRVAKTIANRLGKPKLEKKFFEYIWNGWLCLATPVLANTGTERGLPISCYKIDVDDSIYDIGQKTAELMNLAKHGGGVGITINRIRPAGTPIKNNGTTDGVVPFCKIFDSAILATNQGSTRRGAASINLNINHGDFWDFLEIREPKGDFNRQCGAIHQCIVVDEKFKKKLEEGDEEAKKRWVALLKKRKATGEPYIMFKDNVNNDRPESYINNGLFVKGTNICVSHDTTLKVKINGEISECFIWEVGELMKLFENEVFVLSKNVETGENEFKKITNFALTSKNAKIIEIETESGKKIKCTPEHKIYTKNRGYVMAKELNENDILEEF
jgi:ribonucleoside-diphosphate reductase alpha chain